MTREHLSAAACLALLLSCDWTPPPSPAARGEVIAKEAGCFACHGAGGLRGIRDPAIGEIASWDGRVVGSLVRNRDEVREWILDGSPKRLREADADTTRLIPMPAYKGRLSDAQVDDLIAYFLAVSGWNPELANVVFEGKVLAERFGCLGCHGPSGMGGIANPGSLKGRIPPWDGPEFAELVINEQELEEWILDGHPRRLWENPVARGFLERQVIQMPAYRRHLSEDDVTKLMAYIQSLRPSVAVAPKPAAPAPPEVATPAGPEPTFKSPVALLLTRKGTQALVANQGSHSISVVDVATRAVIAEIPLPAAPTQLALSPDERTLFVSCEHDNAVVSIDLGTRQLQRRLETGDEPQGLVVSPDGKRLFVADYLSGDVRSLDLATGKTLGQVAVGVGPRFLRQSLDGTRLLVTNGLGRSVSIIDLTRFTLLETRDLGRASIIRDVAISPDGRWAFVAHVLSRDDRLPVQLERGWIHSNGISFLDLTRPGHFVTLLLDRLFSGAANPYGLTVSPDGKRLYVTVAGVHEVAIVELEATLALVNATPRERVDLLAQDVEIMEKQHLARRVPSGGLGPRALALDSTRGELWVANHFTDSLTVLDATTGAVKQTLLLGPVVEMSLRRKGELLFNDARITYQTWFSCVSCHEEDAGIDALTWDLPNDGTGNTKNVKSLHDAFDTPPSMWTGVRTDMGAAVMAGQRFQGLLPGTDNQAALVAYLSAFPRVPNPNARRDLEGIRRGARVFERARCSTCHPAPRFTDLRKHDLGLGGRIELSSRFDTPSLRECYRSAPYLHDGRAPTLASIFRQFDPLGVHGRTRDLQDSELDDLVRYLRSL